MSTIALFTFVFSCAETERVDSSAWWCTYLYSFQALVSTVAGQWTVVDAVANWIWNELTTLTYGHTMRKQGSCREKEIMQGTMPVPRKRGRPSHSLDGQHQDVYRKSQSEWQRTEINGESTFIVWPTTWQDSPWKSQSEWQEDRDKWRKYIHHMAKPRIEDG